MRYLTNALGTYEVNVARYYYNRGAYIAAVNRAQAALVGYPQTPANEDALDVLRKSYDKLGLTQLRDDSLRDPRADLSGEQVSRRTPSRSRGGSSGSTRKGRSLRRAVLAFAMSESPEGSCSRAPGMSPRALALGRFAARAQPPVRKNASTSFNSRVRRIGGRLCQMRRPYGLSVSRGSQIISTPRSVSVRIRRPAPCFRLIAACGSC